MYYEPYIPGQSGLLHHNKKKNRSMNHLVDMAWFLNTQNVVRQLVKFNNNLNLNYYRILIRASTHTH